MSLAHLLKPLHKPAPLTVMRRPLLSIIKPIERPKPPDLHPLEGVTAPLNYWGVVYELPDGPHCMLLTGAESTETVMRHARSVLGRNPEARVRSIEPVTSQSHYLETVHDRIVKERQAMGAPDVQQYTGGDPDRCLRDPWCVPGSKIGKPAARIAANKYV